MRCRFDANVVASASFTPISITTTSGIGSGERLGDDAAPKEPRPTSASIASDQSGSAATSSSCDPSISESPITTACGSSATELRFGSGSQRRTPSDPSA